VALVVVTLAVLAAVAYRAANASSAARAALADASGLLSQAEPAVLAIDQAVRSDVTTAAAETARSAIERIDAATSTLRKAQDTILRARSRLAERDFALADALEDSIEARLAMLERARPILETDVRVARALASATEAWELVARAEKRADEAVAAFNKHTKDGVTRSTKLATEADGLLAQARSLLETATAEVPEADLSPFAAYIDAKRALLAESRKIDATWLAGKVADANAMLAAYNAKEKQVAEQAKKLPGTPASVLAQAYKRIVEPDVTAYFDARERARSADTKVRLLSGE
jgi:DNA repair exonuclease SbcCD ATPase subunit